MSDLDRSDAMVSVIVPCFNYGHLIGQTLASVIGQTHAAWECVVVDDGSTDDTAAVVARVAAREPRVRYVRRENGGLAAARNTGIAAARGAYLQFLDADDLLEPEKLAWQASFLDREADVDVVYGDVRYFHTDWPDERLRAETGADVGWMPRTSGRGDALVEALVRRNILVVNAALVRRAVVEAVGGFDGSLRHGEDWDFWLRCALAGRRFEYRDEPGTRALVRLHPGSLSRDFRKMAEAEVRLRDKVGASGLAGAGAAALNARLRDDIRAWLNRIDDLRRAVDAAVPAGAPFLLADQEEVRQTSGYGARARPFPARDGRYDGLPLDGPAAVAALREAAAAGARYLVVAWPARWWLDHYAELAAELGERAREVRADETCRIFDLCPA